MPRRMQMSNPHHLHTALSFVVVAAVAIGYNSANGDEASNAETPDVASVPMEWTDAATGYKVIRLTRRPGPNLSFYFHNNPFVPALKDEGDKMLFYGKTDEGMQLFS